MLELGSKHECLNCKSKFYDLGRSEIVCPKCGGDQKELAQEAEETDKAAKKPRAAAPKAKAKVSPDADESGSPSKEIENDEKKK